MANAVLNEFWKRSLSSGAAMVCSDGELVCAMLYFISIFYLDTVEKISDDLFLALSVVLVSFLSEKCAEFMLAHREIGQR